MHRRSSVVLAAVVVIHVSVNIAASLVTAPPITNEAERRMTLEPG